MLRSLLLVALSIAPMALHAASEEDYAAHIRELTKRVPKGFTVVEQRPFVVVGDEPAATVRRRAENTVKWAVDKLKKDFFTRDPEEIIDIWLFKDKASYEKHTAEIFNDRPTTPYGYYSPGHRALIMNIATGGGTLVHEIVHPFMRANFPACPAWFNEGMGSLYEQCHEVNGHIVGLTNWRLPILQKAIRDKTTVTFPKLLSKTDGEFYKDRGPHYAQARYLCHYLQEKGLLGKYYRQFLADHKKDPTGLATLGSVLETDDWDAFKKKWEEYVMKLRFP